MLRSLIMLIAIATTALTLNSCSDDGYSLDSFQLEVVTVVPQDGNSFYLKRDNGTTLWPAAPLHMNYEPKNDQRALLNYTILSDAQGGYDHYIKINSMQNVLTKAIAADLGAKNDSVYGVDPVSIRRMYIGDNYLNVQFDFNDGGIKAHFINLVNRSTADAPYVLEFRHNAFGDPAVVARTGIVSFNLADLANKQDKAIKLVIRVKTFQGDREYKIDYTPGIVSDAAQEGLSMPDDTGIN
ncbi:MAG: NigD-like protein [Tannerellaceae bacterium]